MIFFCTYHTIGSCSFSRNTFCEKQKRTPYGVHLSVSDIKKRTPFGVRSVLEVLARFELANNGFADRGLTTWLRYHMKQGTQDAFLIFFGAGDEARTRYLHLGKVALYRMSYTRILVPPVGIEPTTRGFSVRCSTY